MSHPINWRRTPPPKPASHTNWFVGLSSLRIKGLYLAIATLAAQYVFIFIAQQWESVTGGDRGIQMASAVANNSFGTGDLVTVDSESICLLGRAADLLTLPDGQQLSSSAIEAELMASPYISQAVAVGGPAGGVRVLIELDEVTLRDWARAQSLSFTTLRSFAESDEVQRLIKKAVQDTNLRLPAAARIVASELLPRALDPANGELTPALALRRAMIRNRYAHLLATRLSIQQ